MLSLPTFFFLILLPTDSVTFVANEPFPGGYGPHQRAGTGELLLPTVAWGASFIVILIIYLIKELLKKSKGKVHIQKVKLFLLTTIIVTTFVVIYNVTPALWNYPVDIAGLLIAAILLTYGILRYELVDVNVRLRNTLVNIIFAIFLAGAYSLLIVVIRILIPARFDDYIWWPAIIAAIYVTSISLPFRERVLKLVDITFYRTRYDYRETIDKFTSNVGEILNLGELSESIIKTIKETFGSKSVHLFILSKERYREFKCSKNCYFDKSDQIIKLLYTSEGVIGEDEIDKSLFSTEQEKHFDPKVIIPLKSGPSLVGFLLISQRVSKDFYSGEDKNLLSILGKSTAIALKNSLLYQEVLENEKEIGHLLEHEREVNKSKNEFVTIASHYLRTPLTTIKGYLGLLLQDSLTSVERQIYLTKTNNEQKRLSSLVEDLITISTLEKGGLKLFKRTVSLSSLLKKVTDDFASQAKEKKLYLKMDSSPKIEDVKVDSQKLLQAISNLVSNAIKFTSVGGVTMKVKKKGSGVKICVLDTGIGIGPEELPRIFEKFHRGTSITTFNYEGSGLGLYITKLIVETHGGEIKVSSELGKGSEFCIYLPID